MSADVQQHTDTTGLGTFPSAVAKHKGEEGGAARDGGHSHV